MKINHSTKEITISIRELAQVSDKRNFERPRSIGLSNRIRTTIGRDIHIKYQNIIKIRKKNVKTEHQVKYDIRYQGWVVKINGRADVVYEEDQKIIVEEIKSTTDVYDSKYKIRQDYIKQLQMYAYGFFHSDKKILCNMVIYDILNGRYHSIPIKLENPVKLINDQVKSLIDLHLQIKNKKLDSTNSFETLAFPFDKFRRNQEKLINLTYKTLENKNSILFSAPSGMGKTIGTLFPTIKYALKNNLRVFVATSKTTQQRIYENTLKIMTKQKAKFNSIILTAKEKICNNVEFNCDPTVCQYLDNYINSDTSKSIERLLTKNVLNSSIVKREANISLVCAFELSLDASLSCDVIVGDYNYIFHPQIRLRRFFDTPFKDSIVIIDEAHNLVQRAIEYYSPSISQADIDNIQKHLRLSKLTTRLRKKGKEIIEQIGNYISNFESLTRDDDKWKTKIIEIDKDKTIGFQKHYDFFILKYIRESTIKHKTIPIARDPIIEFAEKLNYFNSILKESSKPEFSQLYKSEEKSMNIFCISAARKLTKQIKGFHSAIAQSATLFPLEYFQKMLGFPDNSHIEEFESTFPKENQLRMTYPLVSTKYHDRSHYEDDIVHLILVSTRHKKGNYLIFFPSFSYLKSISTKLRRHSLNIKLLIQEPNMNDKKRRYFLKKLQEKDQNYLLLGVHGGIFSEGVDFVGKMAIGVFIIGPGLPAYTFEQDLKKKYFQEKWKMGFQYAYRNPGMNKVIQAAGRIFRSETDKGFVILIGQRFDTPFYSEVLPKYWEITSQKYPEEVIRDFWTNQKDVTLLKTTSLDTILQY